MKRTAAALIMSFAVFALLFGGMFVASSRAETVTIPVPAAGTVSGSVCQDEALSVSIPSNVRTVRWEDGSISYRNASDTPATVRVNCAGPAILRARPVSIFNTAAEPDAVKLLSPGSVWYPRPCAVNPASYAYSDVSVYRSNGRAMGPQTWLTKQVMYWNGNPRHQDAGAYFYNYAGRRPYFINNTFGRVLAAVWCG